VAARTERVTKERYLNYLRKSDEFHRSAEEAARRGDWTAAVSNAVHSGISMADALTVFYAGERSTAQDHDEAMRLLATLGIARNELDRNMKHLFSLLEVKNLAEYEDRLLGQSEAESAMRNADRFRRWVLSRLPERSRYTDSGA
jgi:HEPN domain-containing protein